VRIAHYLNQFFAGLGGTAAAGHLPTRIEGPVGPGKALGLEVAYTLACGDDYFGEHEADALAVLLDLLEADRPEVLICGPAFGSGRYGYACGSFGREVARRGIPVVAAMDVENPGVLAAGGSVHVIPSGPSVLGMKATLPRVAALAEKLAAGVPLGTPEEEGYLGLARRQNRLVERNSAERGVDMILAKVGGRAFVTEIPPDGNVVPPAPPVSDLAGAVVALVTEAGCVPFGNPDRLESNRATTWLRYRIEGLKSLEPGAWESVHGGFDTTMANRDPNRLAPLDALRQLEREGRIGKLHKDFYVTTGNNTSVAMSTRIGQEIADDLAEAGVDAIVLTGT
jgi:glycine reductase